MIASVTSQCMVCLTTRSYSRSEESVQRLGWLQPIYMACYSLTFVRFIGCFIYILFYWEIDWKIFASFFICTFCEAEPKTWTISFSNALTPGNFGTILFQKVLFQQFCSLVVFLKHFSRHRKILKKMRKSTQMNTVKMSCLEVLRLSTNAICRSHLHKKGPFFLLKTKFRKLTGSGYSTGLKFIVKSFC